MAFLQDYITRCERVGIFIPNVWTPEKITILEMAIEREVYDVDNNLLTKCIERLQSESNSH